MAPFVALEVYVQIIIEAMVWICFPSGRITKIFSIKVQVQRERRYVEQLCVKYEYSVEI